MTPGLITGGIIAIVLGFALAVLEMILPGFGFPGIAGILLIAAGLWVMRLPLDITIFIGVGIALLLVIAFLIVVRSGEKGRLGKSKLVLKDEFKHEDAHLCNVGDEGVAMTVLRPAGIAEIDGKRLNVVSEGEFIAKGEKIRVQHADGNRICVEKVS